MKVPLFTLPGEHDTIGDRNLHKSRANYTFFNSNDKTGHLPVVVKQICQQKM
ncbi:MAG: hypothetical protein PUP90_08645 [Nostoc sp. S4]|nr:hypothetical protein [Nostoc sp. S4]